MYLGQSQDEHGCDHNDNINENLQRSRVIVFPANTILTITIFRRTTKVNITILMDENLDPNVNINISHIELKIIWVVKMQPNQNIFTRYQRGNQEKQILFIFIILCRFLL